MKVEGQKKKRISCFEGMEEVILPLRAQSKSISVISQSRWRTFVLFFCFFKTFYWN